MSNEALANLCISLFRYKYKIKIINGKDTPKIKAKKTSALIDILIYNKAV